MTQWIIYKHTSLKSGKSYIGLTMRSMRIRWNRHVADANSGSDVHFHRAIRLYGKDNWSHEIVADSIDTLEEAESLESFFIKKFDTFENGYNSTYGGKGTSGFTMSEEQLKAHRLRMKNHPPLSKESLELSVATRRANLPRHKWIHFDGTKETLASFELAQKYGMSCSHVNSVYKGLNKSCFGWEIDIGQTPIENTSVDYGTVTFHHEYFPTVTGTVKEIADKVRSKVGNVRKVLRGERKHFLGYTLLNQDPTGLTPLKERPFIFKNEDGVCFKGSALQLQDAYDLKNLNNLQKVISGERKQVHGWYIVDSEDSIIFPSKTRGKNIAKYTVGTMKLIAVYGSAKKAGVSVGSKDGSSIDKICRNRNGGELYGFYWEYTNSTGAKRQREIEDAEFKSYDATEKLHEQGAINRAMQIDKLTQGNNNGNI